MYSVTILLMLRKHLVIVGAGWAGLKVARQFKHIPAHQLRITLVSDTSNFRYSAALYRVATGRREHEAIIPIGEVLEDLPNVDFVKATVSKIDRHERVITTTAGKKLHYDYAVIAVGAVTNYFGIPGLNKWSYSIKTAGELRKLRTHLHQELIDEHSLDKNYVVIGAGPTGTELAAALVSYLKIVAKKHGLRRRRINVSIVEAAPRVLPASSPTSSMRVQKRLQALGIKVMLNKKVESEENDFLLVSGKQIPTHTVIWTAGVANNPFFAKNNSQFELSKRGRVVVNDHLQVDKHLYVIGDNAETPFAGLGLTAVHNATYVAKDIKRHLSGHSETPAYKPLVPATVVPVGARWAVFQYRKFVITGMLGAILRSLADLVAYHDILGIRHGLKIWLSSESKEETCTICRSTLDTSGFHELFAPHQS